MLQLLDDAGAGCLAHTDGTILRENGAMLDLAARMGFVPVLEADASESVKVTLALREPTASV